MSGIWPVDPDHSQLKQWMIITDHVPIGGLLCTADKDPKVKELYYRAVNNRHPQDKRDYSDVKLTLEELNKVRADKGLPPLEKEDAFYYPPKAKG